MFTCFQVCDLIMIAYSGFVVAHLPVDLKPFPDMAYIHA
jgi:hypothetical protein